MVWNNVSAFFVLCYAGERPGTAGAFLTHVWKRESGKGLHPLAP